MVIEVVLQWTPVASVFFVAVAIWAISQTPQAERFGPSNSGLFLLAAAAIAALGWSIGALVQIDLNKKKHTTEFITSIIYSDRYDTAIRSVREGVKRLGFLPQANLRSLIEFGSSSKDEWSFVRSVGFVANYYEVLLIAADNGYINVDLIEEYMHDTFEWFHPIVEPMAVIWREDHERAFEALEKYYVSVQNKPPFGESAAFKERNPS